MVLITHFSQIFTPDHVCMRPFELPFVIYVKVIHNTFQLLLHIATQVVNIELKNTVVEFLTRGRLALHEGNYLLLLV